MSTLMRGLAAVLHAVAVLLLIHAVAYLTFAPDGSGGVVRFLVLELDDLVSNSGMR